MTKESDFETLEEASERSRIPMSTLRKKIDTGLLRAYKPGKRVLIKRKDLDLFIERAKISSAS